MHHSNATCANFFSLQPPLPVPPFPCIHYNSQCTIKHHLAGKLKSKQSPQPKKKGRRQFGDLEKSCLDKFVASSVGPHCSKSSFFVQKFNFDFPRKLSIFLGEKLGKMLWFWTTFQLLTTLISREKLSKKIWVKNSRKCRGFVKIEFLDKILTFRIVWFQKRITHALHQSYSWFPKF